jgi:hypothetical protein
MLFNIKINTSKNVSYCNLIGHSCGTGLSTSFVVNSNNESCLINILKSNIQGPDLKHLITFLILKGSFGIIN